jgi:hypothetical protein
VTDTIAKGLLLILLMVVFANYAKGTLPEWLAAKFLNRANPNPLGVAGSVSGVAGVGGAVSGRVSDLPGVNKVSR